MSDLRTRVALLACLVVGAGGVAEAPAARADVKPQVGWGGTAPGTPAWPLAVMSRPSLPAAAELLAPLFPILPGGLYTGAPQIDWNSVHLLRQGIGGTDNDLYAYDPPGGGATCFMLVDSRNVRRQECPSGPFPSGHAGALFGVVPGGPGWRGEPSDLRGMIVGIVADRITAVTAITRAITVPLSIVDNAFCAELPYAHGQGFNVTLRFTYADGTHIDQQVTRQGAGRLVNGRLSFPAPSLSARPHAC